VPSSRLIRGAAVLLGILGAGFASVPAKAEFLPREIAILQGLDKITARVTEFQVDVGTRAQFGALSIHVQSCFSTPPTEPPESAAFVQIDELKDGVVAGRLLSGWMYASSPAIHALEHPVYDVWVKACFSPEPEQAPQNSSVEESTQSE